MKNLALSRDIMMLCLPLILAYPSSRLNEPQWWAFSSPGLCKRLSSEGSRLGSERSLVTANFKRDNLLHRGGNNKEVQVCLKNFLEKSSQDRQHSLIGRGREWMDDGGKKNMRFHRQARPSNGILTPAI